MEDAPYWSLVSTAAHNVEKRHFAVRAATTSESDDFEGSEKTEVAREAGEPGVVDDVVMVGSMYRLEWHVQVR